MYLIAGQFEAAYKEAFPKTDTTYALLLVAEVFRKIGHLYYSQERMLDDISKEMLNEF